MQNNPVPEGKSAMEDALYQFLDTHKLAYTTVEHEAVFTVEDSEELHQKIPGGHTKNLFLKDKKGKIFLITAAHETHINLKNLHKTLEAGRLSFGKPELLLDTLGVTPGSVTAFALLNDMDEKSNSAIVEDEHRSEMTKKVTFILDKSLLDHDIICCHPMRNTATTSISRADLLTFCTLTGHEPQIIDFSQI